MSEYASNSKLPAAKPNDESRPTAAELAPVTTGKVIIRKPSLGKRFKSVFTGDDGRTVATHVLWDVLIPAAKDMLYDAGQEALGRSLGLETRGGRRGRGIDYNMLGSTIASRVNYNRPGFMQDPRDRRDEPGRRKEPIVTRGRVGLEDIILATRVEGDEVIAKLGYLINQYGQATIADLFDIVGVTGQYTDEKFGWRNVDSARPHKTRDGYLLDLPMPIQLD